MGKQVLPVMKILSIPGRYHENRYFSLMLEALEAAGAEVIDPRSVGAATFQYDVLCLSFPTHYATENGPLKAFFMSMLFGSYLLLAHGLRRKIVYIVHDVEPLNRQNEFILDRFLKLILFLTDGYVFISKSSRSAFTTTYPTEKDKPHVLIPHGPYPTTVLTTAERKALRRSLVGEEDVVLLGFLGNIKPYKNAAALRTLPASLPDGRRVRTVIAGPAESRYEYQIKELLDSLVPGSFIRLDQVLSDAELDALIQTVDVVLLPYLRGSNSGLALLVLANEGRFIGSSIPILQELETDVGAPWVTIANLADGLSTSVAQVFSSPIRDSDREFLREYLKRIDFSTGGRTLHAFCSSLYDIGTPSDLTN